MLDPQNPQVPPIKDPNELPDLGPPQPAPSVPTQSPGASASAPPPAVPPQSPPPQVPASPVSSSEIPPNSGQNTSGMGSGSEVPPGVDGWGWGPFFLTWIWGVFNGVWVSLIALIPIGPIGIIMAIVLGINGRKWAWQNKKWESVEHFNKTQRKWSIAGLLLIVGAFLLGIVVVLVVAFATDFTKITGQ